MNVYHPALADIVIVALLGIASVTEYFVVAARRGRISSSFRVAWYVETIVILWALSSGIVAVWIAAHRSWHALLLGPVGGWRLVAGLVPVGVYLLLAVRDVTRIVKRASFSEKFMASFGSVIEIMPHTRSQFNLFMLVAITAGCCEELIFRGFLFSFFAAFVGPVAGVIASSVLFGLAHAYQGRSGIIRSGIFGLAASILALAARSLVPVIVLHVAIDVVSGIVGYHVISAGGWARKSATIQADAATARVSMPSDQF